MTIKPKFMKKIMTKKYITRAVDKYSSILKKDEKLFDSIKDNVTRAHTCGNTKFGYIDYYCPKCNSLERHPTTCKSRLCNKCGKIYAEKWANKLSNDLLNVAHRHLVFSMPENIREFVYSKREILTELTIEINKILKAIIYDDTKNIGKKKKLGRPKKGKKKKKSKRKFGLVVVIHTFGRAGNFNPHFHCLMTEGYFNEDSVFKSMKFFPYTFLRMAWKTVVTKVFNKYFKDNQVVKNLLALNYKKSDSGFYVNADQSINQPKGLAKYIGRYLARPAIAEYRITDFSNDKVTYWYQDSKTKSKREVRVPVEDFIFNVLSHIPHKNFRLVHRFGLYCRRLSQKDKELFKKSSSKLFKLPSPSWVERLTALNGISPIACKNCFFTMKKKFIYDYRYGHFEFP